MLVSLFGFAFLAIGGWELWSAYTFASHATIRPGTFKGYHTVFHETTITDSDGHSRPSRTEEALPMFSYTDADGRIHAITGAKDHPFRHLEYGQSVEVLVPRDPSLQPRLGDSLSLYGKESLSCLVGVAMVLLSLAGVRGVSVVMGPAGILRRVGDARLPIGGMALMLGGFLLLAASVMVLAYFYSLERNDPALLGAIEAGDEQKALFLATECRGVDAKNASGETAMVAALKAGQAYVADAILDCFWISAGAVSKQGDSTVRLAAELEAPRLVRRLVKKGGPAMDVPPALVHDWINAGDAAAIQILVENGFDLRQTYRQRSFGDLALIAGQPAIARLIHDHGARFTAPPAFIALALDDAAALKAALGASGEENPRFNGWTLDQFATKINRNALLAAAQSTAAP
ncbi:hypothetical protein DSCO28_34170 [Desulfosarcina ovata subsp. sediminis]|uniref:DUF3592 domain-containing protein n=2 Tax=Desulfosarcina ovata TaxID=83564 RepID=A0A5K7ZNN7_9BACT|nr:hypothetical protein DSCO28_34170 [Desulfosarcina ovata subsp. sediminis]